MLQSLRELEGFTVRATDGVIGTVSNFLLDDERWVARYLVVDPEGSTDGRQLLISPISFAGVNPSPRNFHLALTQAQVSKGPDLERGHAFSRKQERDHSRYYGHAAYWGYPGNWGRGARPTGLMTGWEERAEAAGLDAEGEVHLRSAHDVRGYAMHMSHEALGSVEDFLVDDETWEVRYLVIDTGNWWSGQKILVPPAWADRVAWDERKVFVELSREAIKGGPLWDGRASLDRDYEARLFTHFHRPGYWDEVDRKIRVEPPAASVVVV